MTDERLYEIANAYIADEKTCMSYNYKNKDITIYDRDELIRDIKTEMRDELGICGCGRPDEALKGIYEILLKFKKSVNEDTNEDNDEICNEIIKWADEDWSHLYSLYILNEVNYLLHGHNVYGSWITEKGKYFLDIFEDG